MQFSVPSSVPTYVKLVNDEELQELRAKVRVLEIKRADDARHVTELETKLSEAENARMMKLYRQHVLKEEPQPELVQLSGIAPAHKTEKVEEQEEVGSFGD